jgi:hypothetical protein
MDWPKPEKTQMQVQPIIAIRPPKIRQRPAADVPSAGDSETRSQPEFVPTSTEATPVAVATPVETRPHAYSERTAHLLITHQAYAQTALDRSNQMESYAAANRSARSVPSVSFSV